MEKMKTITKEYLEEEIESMLKSQEIMTMAAGSNPFGASMDLQKAAEEHLENAEERIRVAIWQKHRIAVLKSLLEKLE